MHGTHTHTRPGTASEACGRACIGVQHHANFHCCDKNKQVWGAEGPEGRGAARLTMERPGEGGEGREAGWGGVGGGVEGRQEGAQTELP